MFRFDSTYSLTQQFDKEWIAQWIYAGDGTRFSLSSSHWINCSMLATAVGTSEQHGEFEKEHSIEATMPSASTYGSVFVSARLCQRTVSAEKLFSDAQDLV